jgi:hypothetical protein
LLRIRKVDFSDCTQMLYPGGVERVSAPADFNELDSLIPPLQRQFSKAGKSMVDLMMAEAVRRATVAVGRECLGKNAALSHKAVEQCLAKRPELKDKFRSVVMAQAIELSKKQYDNINKLLRSHLLWPLCRHYAGKLRGK